MLIDCDSCAIRGAGCSGCLVTALLETPPDGDLGAAERQRSRCSPGRSSDVLATPGGRPARTGRRAHPASGLSLRGRGRAAARRRPCRGWLARRRGRDRGGMPGGRQVSAALGWTAAGAWRSDR